MKRFTLIIALLSIATFSFAQTDQGAIMAGGSASLAIQNQTVEFGPSSSKSDATAFSLAPDIGLFIMDNVVVGGNLSLSLTSGSNASSESSSTALVIGPFGRYYLPSGVFAHGGVGFGISDSKLEIPGSTTSESKNSVFRFELGGGFAIFLNDHVAIEPMALYRYQTITDRDQSANKIKLSDILIQVGFNIFLHNGD